MNDCNCDDDMTEDGHSTACPNSIGARLAAAREEQREACARYVGAEFDLDVADESVRHTPLTSTPLADRIAELEQHKEALAQSLEQMTARVGEVEAERDALRAQLLAERERMEKWLTAPDGKQYERGTVQGVFDEVDALRAQVEAARAVLASLLPGDGKVNHRGVDWGVFAGRRYLSVAGRTVAMEGDTSRDMDTGPAWTGEDLKVVVENFAAPIRAALAAMSEAKP